MKYQLAKISVKAIKQYTIAGGLEPLEEDPVFKDCQYALRSILSFSRIAYSETECFLFAVLFCKRLIKKRSFVEMNEELEKIIAEYDDREVLQPALLLCIELTYAVGQSKHYNLQYEIAKNLRENIRASMSGSHFTYAYEVWRQTLMLVGTVYEAHEDFSDYTLPEWFDIRDEQSQSCTIAGLVDNVLSCGNISECETLRHVLLDYNRKCNNQINAEIDELTNGIKNLQRKYRENSRQETNYIYTNGSVHQDNSKHMTVKSISKNFPF